MVDLREDALAAYKEVDDQRKATQAEINARRAAEYEEERKQVIASHKPALDELLGEQYEWRLESFKRYGHDWAIFVAGKSYHEVKVRVEYFHRQQYPYGVYFCGPWYGTNTAIRNLAHLGELIAMNEKHRDYEMSNQL